MATSKDDALGMVQYCQVNENTDAVSILRDASSKYENRLTGPIKVGWAHTGHKGEGPADSKLGVASKGTCIFAPPFGHFSHPAAACRPQCA